MQLLFDFLPIIVFFVVYKLSDIYVATGAIIVAMAVQMAVQWYRERKINQMLLVSGALVALLGGVTLALRDPLFIQWKPTLVNWLFAAAFLGTQVFGRKTLVERIMGHAVQLEPSLWRQLNMMWVVNFLFLGAANLYVVYTFSEEIWVNFKLFGMVGLTLLTAVGQAFWIAAKTSASEQKQEET